MPQVSILIADNNESFTCLLEESLSMNPDMKIIGVAKDGIETLEIIESKHPDVLLLDIVMPKADGFEVLRRMNNCRYRPRIFMISALGSPDIVDKAMLLGADYFFVKPLNSQTVLAKIRECMQV